MTRSRDPVGRYCTERQAGYRWYCLAARTAEVMGPTWKPHACCPDVTLTPSDGYSVVNVSSGIALRLCLLAGGEDERAAAARIRAAEATMGRKIVKAQEARATYFTQAETAGAPGEGDGAQKVLAASEAWAAAERQATGTYHRAEVATQIAFDLLYRWHARRLQKAAHAQRRRSTP